MTDNSNRLVQCTCIFCGNTFFSVRKDAKTCSSACRSRLMRWRKRIQRLEHDTTNYLAQITHYLDFAESRFSALEVVKRLKRHIDRELEERNIDLVVINRKREA